LAPDLVEVFKEAIKEDTSLAQKGLQVLAA
jgi:hypothetical protein